ncbi:MAG: methionyl-tRNA formyltransferase [Beijerinckiaceae bacterium]|nr:methionyl-tRNA formyltransferase [Beijerinckiaceae bacterium]MCZ8299198.1 methionyl-tRNA formyltransferase [Beijerinckiaceae bacterium]
MSLRVVFMGTPDFAVPTLTEIIGQGHDVVAVYTRAPAPGGRRGLDLVESPVHRCANGFGIPVLTPKSLRNAEAQAAFAAHESDVAVVVAYGLLLPKPVLDAPTLGCLNLHGSLLPRWRGAAPIHRAIMAGDRETGVMVMQMDEGLDTGPVAMVERIAIGPDMTTGQLHDRMRVIGADLMARALAALERGSLGFQAQAETGVTYAHKISKAECRIDFTASSQSVHNQIRGLFPFPGAYLELDWGAGPKRIKIGRARPVAGKGEAGTVLDDALTFACGEGAVQLLEVQPAGKGMMSATEFLRGAAVKPGLRALAGPAA